MADKPSAPVAPPAPAPFVPYKVRAIREGTYPDQPGGRARYRVVGEEFLIFAEEHFASGDNRDPQSLGWMQLAAQPKPALPDPNMPITTANNIVRDPMSLLRL